MTGARRGTILAATDMSYTKTLLDTTWTELPAEVRAQAKRCLRDIIATAAGSTALPTHRLTAELALTEFASGRVPLWFTGRKAGAVGAAYFNAQAVDSLDCHDGFRLTKGHCGATVVPVILGACAAAPRPVSGPQLLTAVVMGYELAARAGLAVHARYQPAYHASGSWASLGAAAAACRILGFDASRIDEVVGMAEYYAPMSPMIRCTDHPSAVKDAAGPGAWAAAMAIALAERGLPGLPSIFTADELGREAAATLGEDWIILRQYFKPYPTCRWAQPVIEGLRLLRAREGFDAQEVEEVQVETFAHAAALTHFPPRHSDAAQYSLPWAAAVFLADGEVGVRQIHPSRLDDARVIELGRRVRTAVAADLEARYPREALARTNVLLRDGRLLRGPTLGARGDYTDPLSEAELEAKARALMEEGIGTERSRRLLELLRSLEKRPALDLLAAL